MMHSNLMREVDHIIADAKRRLPHHVCWCCGEWMIDYDEEQDITICVDCTVYIKAAHGATEYK